MNHGEKQTKRNTQAQIIDQVKTRSINSNFLLKPRMYCFHFSFVELVFFSFVSCLLVLPVHVSGNFINDVEAERGIEYTFDQNFENNTEAKDHANEEGTRGSVTIFEKDYANGEGTRGSVPIFEKDEDELVEYADGEITGESVKTGIGSNTTITPSTKEDLRKGRRRRRKQAGRREPVGRNHVTRTSTKTYKTASTTATKRISYSYTSRDRR